MQELEEREEEEGGGAEGDSQEDSSVQPPEVLWGWILAHSPTLASTIGFNSIRWNIIVRLYPFSSLRYVRAPSLVFILVKGKDTAFNNPDRISWLKQFISSQHMHRDMNI